MADGYLISGNDAAILKEVIAEFRGRKGNSTRRPNNEYWDEHQAPEVYVARTPSGGIPKLTEETGAGIVDTPGSATCAIYEIQSGGIQPIQGLNALVHNLTADAIEGDTWVVISRTKDGTWVVVAPAPGAQCIGIVFRVMIDAYLAVTSSVYDDPTVPGTATSPVVTGVSLTKKFREITVHPDGCVTIGVPYCEAASGTCSDGEADPTYWCYDGVCYKVYAGANPPPSSTGPHATEAACIAAVCEEIPEQGASVSTDCGVISETLKVAFSTGLEFNITHTGGGAWSGSTGSPDCTGITGGGASLSCAAGVWTIGSYASHFSPASEVVVPAGAPYPFFLEWTGAESGICGGTFSVTISETWL